MHYTHTHSLSLSESLSLSLVYTYKYTSLTYTYTSLTSTYRYPKARDVQDRAYVTRVRLVGGPMEEDAADFGQVSMCVYVCV